MRTFFLDGRAADAPAAVAIGNFDGVHRGHQQVVARLLAVAAEAGAVPSVMTFEPYPREYFQGHDAPPRLTGLRHKLALLREAGVARVYCPRFDRRLAATSAEDFVDDMLIENVRAAHVVVGEDFRFGAGRAGNVALLSARARDAGVGVTAVSDYLAGGERISSTRIRALLGQGDLDTAARLLGRPFSCCGRVQHGDKRGRTIGFPTANLLPVRDAFPLSGVFVVSMRDGDGEIGVGVANVGRRPTVAGLRLRVETHLLDYGGDLYGRLVEVTFLHRVRGEQRFDSFDALKVQIGRDIDSARAWLAGSAAGGGHG